MEWALAVVALALIGFGVVSRRVDGTPVTPAILFVGVGLLVGTQALELVDPSATSESVKRLAEATLTVVLFADASRIDLRTLRREYAVPARLLGIGLPLTIALGAVLAAAFFGALSIPEALVLAVLLAPTDAALGQAVVTEPTLPSRIRQGLNVESGLNDGICVPLLFIVLAVAEAEDGRDERVPRRPSGRRGDRVRDPRRSDRRGRRSRRDHVRDTAGADGSALAAHRPGRRRGTRVRHCRPARRLRIHCRLRGRHDVQLPSAAFRGDRGGRRSSRTRSARC